MMRMTRQATKTMGPTTGARSDASTKLRGVFPGSVALRSGVAGRDGSLAEVISETLQAHLPAKRLALRLHRLCINNSALRSVIWITLPVGVHWPRRQALARRWSPPRGRR